MSIIFERPMKRIKKYYIRAIRLKNILPNSICRHDNNYSSINMTLATQIFSQEMHLVSVISFVKDTFRIDKECLIQILETFSP